MITLTELELAEWAIKLKIARSERQESEAALDRVIEEMEKKLKEVHKDDK